MARSGEVPLSPQVATPIPGAHLLLFEELLALATYGLGADFYLKNTWPERLHGRYGLAQRACGLSQGAKSASKPALRLMQQAQAALFSGANMAVLQRLALHKAGGQGGQFFGGGRADLHALHARGLGALVGPGDERLHGVGRAL